ncbi:MAG: preprotein translocase subunit SecY [Oscillospiraceae bacterium]|jgi:preprotein translocase subunit SecY
MFQTFRNAWKIEELRKRMLFTLLILVLFRLGSAVVVPFVDASVFAASLASEENTITGFFDMMTGGSFSNATLFALGVTPYINASIILQLLQVVIPSLERLSKEGEEGQKKMLKITRYVALGLSASLSVVYYFLVRRNGALYYSTGIKGWFSAIVIILSFTAGAMLLMWMGEQIDSDGIGNGISLLIFTGIISNLFNVFPIMWQYFRLAAGKVEGYSAQPKYWVIMPLVILLFVGLFLLIIYMDGAERRIPVQYAKRVVGRKMYGGQSTHIPIKVNCTGVLPIIFAVSILAVPGTIKEFFGINEGGWATFLGWFNTNNWGYVILYALLILGFNYFYVAIQYNPVEMANNLRKNSGAIPGIRPGKPTADFIAKVLNKITFIGALYLIVAADLPIIIEKITGVTIALGGTSLLIIVGVALEVAQTLDSYMLMRHHKGFLD